MSTESRTFSAALTGLLNDYGIEASSDTPDFILENFVTSCLAAFTVAARTRDQWHGFRPFGGEREAVQARDWLSRKRAEMGEHETTPDPEDGTDREHQITRLRVTDADVDARIIRDQYHVFPGTTVTVCCLTLDNGFAVIGYSAAASPANFDAQAGRKIARADARDKIWELEGYLLRNRLHARALGDPDYLATGPR